MATFGYTTLDASTTRNIEDLIPGGLFTLPENGSVTKLSVGVNIGGTITTKAAIYDSSGNFLVASEERVLTIAEDETFQDFNLSSPYSLLAGNYYLCFWGNAATGTNGLRGATSGGTTFREILTYTGTFPSTVNTALDTNLNKFSIYATYTPSTGFVVALV